MECHLASPLAAKWNCAYSPAANLLSWPVAILPACRCCPQTTLTSGTLWVFNPTALPGTLDTHLATLTPAQSQGLEGVIIGTQHGTSPPVSPTDKTGDLGTPAAPFVFARGAVGDKENGSQHASEEETMMHHIATMALERKLTLRNQAPMPYPLPLLL